MLSMFTAAQFPLILRLVAIAVTLTHRDATDTSGYERLISLMSDLHRQTRSSRPDSEWSTTACALKLWWSAEMDRLTYSDTQNGKRPCRGCFAVGTRIEDINVTMHVVRVGSC